MTPEVLEQMLYNLLVSQPGLPSVTGHMLPMLAAAGLYVVSRKGRKIGNE